MADETNNPTLTPIKYRDVKRDLDEHHGKTINYIDPRRTFRESYQKKAQGALDAALANANKSKDLSTGTDTSSGPSPELSAEWQRFYYSQSMLGKSLNSRYGLDTPSQTDSWYRPRFDTVGYDAYSLPVSASSSGVYAINNGNMFYGRNANAYGQLYSIALEDKGVNNKFTIRFSPSNSTYVARMLTVAALNGARPPDLLNKARQHLKMQNHTDDDINFIKEGPDDGSFTYNKLRLHNENMTTTQRVAQERMFAYHKISRAAYHLGQAGLSPMQIQGAMQKYSAIQANDKVEVIDGIGSPIDGFKAELEGKFGNIVQLEKAFKALGEESFGDGMTVSGVNKEQFNEYFRNANLNPLSRYAFERSMLPEDKQHEKTAVYVNKDDQASRDPATDLGIYSKASLQDQAVIDDLQRHKAELDRQIKQLKGELKDVQKEEEASKGPKEVELVKIEGSEEVDEVNNEPESSAADKPAPKKTSAALQKEISECEDKTKEIDKHLKNMQTGLFSKEPKIKSMLKGKDYVSFKQFMDARADAFECASELNLKGTGKKYDEVVKNTKALQGSKAESANTDSPVGLSAKK